MKAKILTLALALSAVAPVLRGETYAGLSGTLALPQGGGDMRRVGGAVLRGGTYLSDFWAVEGTVGWQENVASLGAGLVGHWTGWELYDRFFGYSSFDPFVTVGVKGWLGRRRGEVGPAVGVGAYYHLDDHWSVRAETDVTLGLESHVETDYSVSVGLQYTF